MIVAKALAEMESKRSNPFNVVITATKLWESMAGGCLAELVSYVDWRPTPARTRMFALRSENRRQQVRGGLVLIGGGRINF